MYDFSPAGEATGCDPGRDYGSIGVPASPHCYSLKDAIVGEFSSRWDMIFAGTAMSIIPVLVVFVFLQKYFVKGLATGAIKG